MHALINLLPEDDRDQLRRKMMVKKLDWQNLCRMESFGLYKENIEMEKNILESCKGIEIPNVVVGTKSKSKVTFNTIQVDSESDEEGSTYATADTGKSGQIMNLNSPFWRCTLMR